MDGIFKCKTCGNPLVELAAKSVDGLVECPLCFNVWTIPKKEASPAALSFLRQGEGCLDTCQFDNAYTLYQKAAQIDEKEPETYWGMALAEFKVQYIKDIKDNRLQPICHEFTEKVFTQNRNYLKTLECATEKQKAEYEKKAQEIDYIRSEFLRLKQSGMDYDCFICVKVSRIDSELIDITNSKKNWTEDAYDADSIYDLLKRHGFNPFYSEREIRGKTGADYEAIILYALYTSETMLVVCRNEEYLKTPWVKNEFTRFKELVNNKEKENDSLTIVFSGTPIERLPGENNGKIQGIDYSRREADLEIVKFVEEHTPVARARREEEKRKRIEQAEELRRQIEEQKHAQQALKETQQELEERLKRLNPNTATGTSSKIEALLTRANQEMETRNFDRAQRFFETVLENAPQNAAAWWGLFLCEFKTTNENIVVEKLNSTLYKKIVNNKNYQLAVRYAAGNSKDRITKFQNTIESAELWWNLFLNDYNCSTDEAILKKVTESNSNKILSNNHFAIALRNATGEFKQKLENFKQDVLAKAQAMEQYRIEAERKERIKERIISIVKLIVGLLVLSFELQFVLFIKVPVLSFIQFDLMTLPAKITFFVMIVLSLVYEIISCFNSGQPLCTIFAQLFSFVVFCLSLYVINKFNLSVVAEWGLLLSSQVWLLASFLSSHIKNKVSYDIEDCNVLLVYLTICIVTVGYNCFYIGFNSLVATEPVLWLDIVQLCISSIVSILIIVVSCNNRKVLPWIFCGIGIILMALMGVTWKYWPVFLVVVAVLVVFAISSLWEKIEG